jgi:hypothetical protein
MGLAQQVQDQPIQLRRRAVESRAAIDVLDLDDAATVTPDTIDRLNPVTPVANEPAFDDPRHGSPRSFLYGVGIGRRLSAEQVRFVAIA